MTCLTLRTIAGRTGLAKTLATLGALLCLSLGASSAQAKDCFGTALVFAIDASSSIDDAEYFLQMTGFSQALRDPEVADAVRNAGGVALAAVVWSDTAATTSTVGWRSVRGSQDIERFARIMESLPRAGGGGTDLGQGIWDALDLLEDPSLCAARHVIDVSGDGKETVYPRRRGSVSTFTARRRAEAAGVVVNGLAILDEELDLEDYYLSQVAVGAGAFVIAANGFEDFGAAMRRKLLREIAPMNQAQLLFPQLANLRTY